MKSFLDDPVGAVREYTKLNADLTKAITAYGSEQQHRWIQENLANEFEAMFERFCPYKVGQRVVLNKTPNINTKDSPGWAGSKHFLIEGALATVRTRTVRSGKFAFLLLFDNASHLDDNGVTHPATYESLYYFTESSLVAL